MNLLKPVLGLLVGLVLFDSVAQAQPPRKVDFSNEGLASARTRAKDLLEEDNLQPSGDSFVLPADYFLAAFKKEYSVFVKNASDQFVIDPTTMQPQKATKRLSETDKLIVVCGFVAEDMLLAAQAEGKTTAEYVDDWHARSAKLLALEDDGELLLDYTQRQVWQAFFAEWESKVMASDADRFQDALRQAAYSILRTGLEEEQRFVDKVRLGTATPGGGAGGSRVSVTADGGFGGGGYYHGDVWHERKLNAIYRRHERRMYKIERVRARR